MSYSSVMLPTRTVPTGSLYRAQDNSTSPLPVDKNSSAAVAGDNAWHTSHNHLMALPAMASAMTKPLPSITRAKKLPSFFSLVGAASSTPSSASASLASSSASASSSLVPPAPAAVVAASSLQNLAAANSSSSTSYRRPLPRMNQVVGAQMGSRDSLMRLSFIVNQSDNRPHQCHGLLPSIHCPDACNGLHQDPSVIANVPEQEHHHDQMTCARPTSKALEVTSILNRVCAKPECQRTIRSANGTFCKYHKQSRLCRAEGCSKSAKTGGFCISHGGGKRCAHEGCSKSAKQGGFCISHGGGKRCKEENCTKSALVGGFCSAHGGGRKCQMENCTKTALMGGFCIAHGGGKRCQVEGCSKSAVGGILCVSHGGGKRCQVEGCSKGAVRNGVCIRHGARRDINASSSSSTSSSTSSSPASTP